MKKPNAPCMDCKDKVPPTKESNGCKPVCELWAEYEKLYQEWSEEYTAYMKAQGDIARSERDRRLKGFKIYKKNMYGK